MQVSSLSVSARCINALELGHINTIGDLVELILTDYKKFTSIRNIGIQSQVEILTGLKDFGIETTYQVMKSKTKDIIVLG